jgi:hypothetical protein
MDNSSLPNGLTHLENFYNKAVGKHISGGSTSGGYSALEDYGNSVYSSAKEKLIRSIAKDVTSMLKVSSSFADSAPISEVVAKLQKAIPDPKNGKNLNNNATMHKELCDKLANSINKNYDMDIIDKSADPAIICNKVAEVLYSLFTGLHSEFLTISGDVSRIVRNLQILNEYINSANEKLIHNLERNGNGADAESESIQTLYTTLTKEIDRQQALLANLTSAVITPVGHSLISLLEDNNDFKGLTADISKLTGTAEFSNKLGFLLNGTGSVVHAAEIVDKALKKIGLTVAEYKNVKGLKELREKVYEKMVKAKPSTEELYKLLAAADILYKNDLMHDDILSHLEKKRGGFVGGSSIGEYDESFADAADVASKVASEDNPFKGRPQSQRKSITKQLDQKKQLRKGLFVTLNTKIKDSYTKIKFALSKLGKKIGNEVDLTPELDMFVRQLDNFSKSQPDRKDIHVALSGYRKDVGTSWVKHQFMENLYAISETIEPLVSAKSGSLFKDIKVEVDQLINLVAEFNETFTNTMSNISVTKLGISGGDCGCAGGDEDEPQEQVDTEVSEPEPVEDFMLSEEVCEGGSGFSPGSAFEDSMVTHLGGVVSNMLDSDFNHFQTMKKSIREIDYYYRIAGIKLNMVKTSAEFDNNTENYENILGEEGGYIIDQIQSKYNKLIESLEPNPNAVAVAAADIALLYAHGHPSGNALGLGNTLKADIDAAGVAGVAAGSADARTDLADYADGYKFLLEYIRSSKVEMLEAAQALDLYLSKFTKSMQLKPDQIKEFIQILEQIEVLAKWFTDKSGDNLVGVFEAFSPGAINIFLPADFAELRARHQSTNANPIRNKLDGTAYDVIGAHYYEDLAAAGAGQYHPGKFYNARMMTRVEAINFVKQIEKSIKSVRSLENIIATFSRVNTTVSADVKTFMSNGSMFKAFMKYAVASSISIGGLVIDLQPVDNENIINGFLPGVINNNVFGNIFAKMAVSLRFSNDKVPFNGGVQLELCDPLRIKHDNHTDICDDIFEMSIKSLVSKIFTVVGSYSLFNRPAGVNDDNLSLSINPLRQILGGAYTVDIIPKATELYVRLPLLVEWYRTVFEFKEKTAAPYAALAPPPVPAVPVVPLPLAQQSNPLISIIPDMDGVWGDICKVIFMDANNINDGAYPTDYANKIIDAINLVYKHYTSKKSDISCREILSEFVLEINRRYGFIMQQEINAYFVDRYSYIDVDAAYPPDDANVDYDLLDVESQIGRRPAPSDKFRAFTKKSTTRKFDITDLLKIAKRFRQSIEENLVLQGQQPGAVGFFRSQANVSLSGIIAEVSKKIKNTDVPEEKYRIVHEQLHGVEKFGDVDQEKMLLFHETVTTPLTTLYFVYLILNDFNRFCVSLNIESDVVGARFNGMLFLDRTTQNYKGANNQYKKDSGDNITRYARAGGVQKYLDANFNIDEYAGLFTDVAGAAVVVGVKFNRTVMEKLLRKVMNVGCDMNGLTEVSFIGAGTNDNYPYINYSKLEETCNTLFNDAKDAFHQLRKFMPLNIIQQYEDINYKDIAGGDHPNRVSLFYIQEQLFDRLFANKYGNGLVDANNGLKNIWRELTKKRYPANAPTEGDSFSDIFSRIGFWHCSDAQLLRHSLHEITGKSPSFPIAFIPIHKSNDTIGGMGTSKKSSQAIINGPLDATNVNNVAADLKPGLCVRQGDYKLFMGTLSYYNLVDNKALGMHRWLGFIPKFNAILYKYCTIFTDNSTKKIYRPLLEKFINGHNAKDILNAKNINDNIHTGGVLLSGSDKVAIDGATGQPIAPALAPLAPPLAPPAPRSGLYKTEPQPGAVLFASIANALKGILVSQADKVSGAVSLFMEDSFLRITEYQKELYRANLPAFEKELNLLVKKAEFMRRCLEETKVNVAVVAVANAAQGEVEICAPLAANLQGNVTVADYTQANKTSAVMSDAERKTYLMEIFTDVSMSAKSLIRCINDVQKELNDSPMYFETYNNSIVDYNTRNGRLPLMPISSITHLMNFSGLHDAHETLIVAPAGVAGAIGAVAGTDVRLAIIPQPSIGAGSTQFKFTYGTRGLLHYKQAPSMDKAPGVEAFLDSYNGKVGGAASFAKAKLSSITTNTITLSRWIIDFMYHNQALCNHDWIAMQKLVLDNQHNGEDGMVGAGGVTPNEKNIANLSCQTGKHGRSSGNPVVAGNYAVWGNMSHVTNLSENDNFVQSKNRLLDCFTSGNAANLLTGTTRSDLRIYNILDLNIVPINVHAMQREVPFVNLFNYSYTFDHIVKNFIGTGMTSTNLRTIVNDSAHDTIHTLPENYLVRNLIFPLGPRHVNNYVSETYRIMSGNTSMALNRPKYLSDQLWNKVLMNIVYRADRERIGRRQIESMNTPIARGGPAVYELNAPDLQLAMAFTYAPTTPNPNNTITVVAGPRGVLPQHTSHMSTEGYWRYNSKLVRWIEWFTQLQRVSRLLMRSQLDWVTDPVVQGITATATEVTEYKKDKVFDLDDYN